MSNSLTYQAITERAPKSVVILAILFTNAGAQVSQQPNSREEVDRSEFEQRTGPVSSVGATGILERKNGACVREAILRSSFFAYPEGNVSVEVVEFPKSYRYAPHDLFGLLATGVTDEVAFQPWEFVDGTKGGIVGVYHREQYGRNRSGGVLWFHGRETEGYVTVVVAYTGLKGLPGRVVDEYLGEYPSNVPERPTWHINWEVNDLEKWADVLRGNNEDLHLWQAWAVSLLRYDKRSFGLLDAVKEWDDPAAFAQTMEEVHDRLQRAIAERRGGEGASIVEQGFGVVGRSVPKIDLARFERIGEPKEVSDVGVQGSCQLLESYTSVRGKVTVRVETNPRGYKFALHDVVGRLLGNAVGRGRGHATLSGAIGEVMCLDWHPKDGSQGGRVCLSQGWETRRVVLGWTSERPDGGPVTVVIEHDEHRRSGRIPGEVVDTLLRKYPSDVPVEFTLPQDWETADVEKWIEMLRFLSGSLRETQLVRVKAQEEANKGVRDPEKGKELAKMDKANRRMLDSAVSYLPRYNDGAFGLIDGVNLNTEGTAGLVRAVDEAVERMSRYLAERNERALGPG